MQTRLLFCPLAIAVSCLIAPGTVVGQDTTMVATDATPVVVVSQKSPVLAGVLEWLVPTVGYAYAGNWARGVPPAAVRITGFILLAADQFTVFGSPPPCRTQCIVGATMAIGGTIWSIVDAAATASRENGKRRRALRGPPVTLMVVPGRGAVGLRIRI